MSTLRQTLLPSGGPPDSSSKSQYVASSSPSMSNTAKPDCDDSSPRRERSKDPKNDGPLAHFSTKTFASFFHRATVWHPGWTTGGLCALQTPTTNTEKLVVVNPNDPQRLSLYLPGSAFPTESQQRWWWRRSNGGPESHATKKHGSNEQLVC